MKVGEEWLKAYKIFVWYTIDKKAHGTIPGMKNNCSKINNDIQKVFIPNGSLNILPNVYAISAHPLACLYACQNLASKSFHIPLPVYIFNWLKGVYIGTAITYPLVFHIAFSVVWKSSHIAYSTVSQNPILLIRLKLKL